jgi:hypothetical protein
MTDNSGKIILDLCGGTGSWSKPYKDAGYDVRLITLPDYDVTQYDITNRTLFPSLRFFTQNHGKDLDILLSSIYGILAAPPCTMFSRARTTAKTPRDFKGSMRTVGACMQIIWAVRSADTGLSKDRSLRFWALENPMGFLRQFLGKPAMSFEPWQYGDMHFKWTDIWGYCNEPKKTHTVRPAKFDREKWANPPTPKQFAHMKLDRAARRAITPQGFAKAFYEANK